MDNLEITSIKIKKFAEPKNNVIAVVSIELNYCLAIHGIKIVELDDKRILSFPARKVWNKDVKRYNFTDIVHPTNSDFRLYLEDKILDLYDGKEKIR